MSHRSRRAPPIECPLASLGHNHNRTADHHQYHHPLSSSPLNPNDYQMSMRKSPLINIGAGGLIQFSTLHETDDSVKSTEDMPHLSAAINRCINDTNDYVNVYRDPLECNLSTTGESDNASSYQPKNAIQTNCELTSEHLFDIAHKRNDRLLMRRTERTRSAMTNYCATIDCSEPYYLEQKMRSLLLNEMNSGERNSTYPFAKTHRATNSIDSDGTESRMKFDRPPKFVQHPSSPSETSESDRYLLERTSQDSPALDLGINRSSYNYSKNHHRISTPSNSNSLIDGMTSRLGRFSPSFDQGYHTLNSPSLSATTSTGSQPMQNTRIRSKSDSAFSKLSDNLCMKLFSWLESRDLVSVSKTCRRFDEMVWRPQLWKTIVLKGRNHIILHSLPRKPHFQL